MAKPSYSLWLVLLLFLSVQMSTSSVIFCTCSCCSSSFECLPNKTFSVNQCDDCSWANCLIKFPECSSAFAISPPTCQLTPNRIWETFNSIFMFSTIVILLMVSVLKPHIPILNNCWENGTISHKHRPLSGENRYLDQREVPFDGFSQEERNREIWTNFE
jgi:hypothetical protein